MMGLFLMIIQPLFTFSELSHLQSIFGKVSRPLNVIRLTDEINSLSI